ncbi:hypothetical protein SAMN05660826_02343 [Caldanaerovirga acetigignens]|uniref:Uncharacterized protein n=1 Tax=Caldanaerovirga acetigignens TaxID=447595 RepID=A0A1M7MLZ1_9FIRM|nr:hypothetical protein [Caldanaerovirga acetigignens]SHM91876.1 hypothetical protein SAMN05660826_02343 [Caldanaerovirga acetigignens]
MLLKKLIVFLIISCLILTTSVFALPQNNFQQLQLKSENEIMEKVMQNLENGEEKENVIYIDENDNVYSNKVELKRIYHKYEVNSNKRSFKMNNIEYALPLECQIRKNINQVDAQYLIIQSGTGAYRRILSKSGYRKVEGYALTTNNIKIVPHTEGAPNTVPYLYLGGRTSDGGEIDAGILYDITTKTWVPFF